MTPSAPSAATRTGLPAADRWVGAGAAAALGAAGVLAAKALRKREQKQQQPPRPPEKQWHYSVGGNTVGPVPESELRRLLPQLPADTIVWNPSLGGWKPAREAGLAQSPPPPPPAQPLAFEIFVEAGPDQGRRFPLSGRISIGRAAECQVVLTDQSVSRVNSIVEQRADDFWISDNHSSNGTRVNGISIQRPTLLKPGDVILVGATVLVFTAV